MWMVPQAGLISNQLFETLTEWESYLRNIAYFKEPTP